MKTTKAADSWCEFRLILQYYRGISLKYKADGSFYQSLVILGRLSDPRRSFMGDSIDYSRGESAFHDKQFILEIISPKMTDLDLDFLHKKSTIDEACGIARIRANVEPKSIKIYDELYHDPPVRFTIGVSVDAFAAFREYAIYAHDNNQIIMANVKVKGFDVSEGSEDSDINGVFLKDIDVSSALTLGIHDFEFSSETYRDRLRDRVTRRMRSPNMGLETKVTILLTECSYEINIESGEYRSVELTGRAVSWREGILKNIRSEITFIEFERNERDPTLRESDFGNFIYLPKWEIDEDKVFLSIYLHYHSKDMESFIIPELKSAFKSKIFIEITLAIETSTLLKATEEVEGKIRSYKIRTSRELFNFPAINS